MEFDISRCYSAVNADELKPGDKVIVADTICHLKYQVQNNNIADILERVAEEDATNRFKVSGMGYSLAYLVERKENCGNCCVICRGKAPFKLNCCKDWKPKTNRNLCDSCKHCFAECPATPGDIIFGCGVGNDNVYSCAKYELKAEKQYRPFVNTDELVKVWDAKYKEKYGLKRLDKGLDMPYIWVRSKFNKDHKGVLINNYFGEYVELNKIQCFLSRLFDEYTFLDGSPCGVEE